MPKPYDLFRPLAVGTPAHRVMVKARQEGARLKARIRRLAIHEKALLREDPGSYHRKLFVLEAEVAEFNDRWGCVADDALGLGFTAAAYVAANSPDAAERAEAARAVQIVEAALAEPASKVRS